jgi:hypothetical protein
MSEKKIDVTSAINAARQARSRLIRMTTADLSATQMAAAIQEAEGWLDDVLMYLGHPTSRRR